MRQNYFVCPRCNSVLDVDPKPEAASSNGRTPGFQPENASSTLAAATPVSRSRAPQEAIDDAATQLLIEIAFLLPMGTNVRRHPIAKTLLAFTAAVRAEALASPPAPEEETS